MLKLEGIRKENGKKTAMFEWVRNENEQEHTSH